MGVAGLWRLLEPVGKPVPLETLENKVLAVDISIWLHQMVKGYKDARGAPLPNAHLIGLFQRLCKLLYYRIKPVFVFDGGFPEIKKETIARRQANKAKLISKSEKLKKDIMLLIGKKVAIGSILDKNDINDAISPKKASESESNSLNSSLDDMFKLPAMPQSDDFASERSFESSSSDTEDTEVMDLHTLDVKSASFAALPLREKHDLLTEAKETRKQNSWGRLHQLPKESANFSSYQMDRLLKRRKVQECLEETEKEMSGHFMSLNDLETLLNAEGINTSIGNTASKRIASNEHTRYLFIKSVKDAKEEAKKNDLQKMSKAETASDSKPPEEYLSDEDDKLQEAIKKSSDGETEGSRASTSKTLSCIPDSLLQDTDSNSLSTHEDITKKKYAQDNIDAKHTRHLFIKSVKVAKEEAKNKDLQKMSKAKKPSDSEPLGEYLGDEDDELQRAIKISLDCIIEGGRASTSKTLPCSPDSLLQYNTDSNLPSTDAEITKKTNAKENIGADLQKAIQMSIMGEGEEPSTCKELAELDSSGHMFLSQELSDESNSSDDSGADPDFDFLKDALKRPRTEIKCPSKSQKTTENIVEKNITPSKNVMGKLPLAGREPKEQLAHSLQERPSQKSNTKALSEVIDLESDSDSHDEAFEEVLDEVLENEKPSIKVVLNFDKIGQENLEDDIFSDVFEILHSRDKVTSQTIAKENLEMSIASKVSFKVPILEVGKMSLQKLDVYTKTGSSSNLSEELKDHDKSSENNYCSKFEIDTSIEHSGEPTPNNRNIDYSTNILTPIESSLASGKKIEEGISEKERENLVAMSQELDIEHEELLQEQYKIDRMGRNISEQMTNDAKELLRLFGIPYVEAPMEAEAQCAFLESAKLTDGTITDDSDIWLFGGRTVYKNFFNQQKHVLQFIAERIEQSYNLAREQMILLALLVGSDYTLGVSGVGPVTAMEILANFPNKKTFSASSNLSPAEYCGLTDGLLDFKKWVRAGKRSSPSSLKNKLKNVQVTDDFPSVRVVQAYFEPEVEKSREAFTWGCPEVVVLREFTRTKFGWSASKLDEILKPVLKRMNERKHQQTIHSFFKRNIEFHSLEDGMSKRVRQAVEQMGSEGGRRGEQKETERKGDEKSIEVNAIEEPNYETEGKKRKVTQGKRARNEKELEIQETLRESKVDNIVRIEGLPNSSSVKTDLVTVTPLLQRYQEIIPQREMDKQTLLKNKLKAIELFRKTKLVCNKSRGKRAARAPKYSAELSESSDSS